MDVCEGKCRRRLARSPGRKVIERGGEPWGVPAKWVGQVPPMAMPAPQGAPDDTAELMRSDALRLFADRAAAVQPGFALRLANVATVAAICRAVDGLPLGIELAAAWVRMLTVEQIAARLADRFMLLSSAERMALPRHRTLRAAIDWSHDLLPPAEKVLLRRLSVFASWPLEMPEDVCAGSQPAGDLAAGAMWNPPTGLARRP